MLLLGIEASTRRLSVALWRDGVVAVRSGDHPNGGSSLLLPWLAELLDEGGAAIDQLDGVAFGAGPGSFTGLRLACGIAQGLAWGRECPLMPVSTLQATALASGFDRVWVCQDARMNEVYCAGYVVDCQDVTEVMAPACLPPAEVPVPTLDGVWGIGDGFASYHDVLSDRFHGLRGIRADAVPTAQAVVTLAAPLLAAGKGVPAALAQPIYVRNKVALTTAERLARGGDK